MTNRTGDEKYEILRGEPSVNNIVFKGGHKYKRSVGNIELDGEINQHIIIIQPQTIKRKV